MTSAACFKEPWITVREEIEKRLREGSYLYDAIANTVTQRLCDVIRSAGTNIEPVVAATREISLSAFKVVVRGGNATSIGAQAILFGLVRACPDIGEDASQVVITACRVIFGHALSATFMPAQVALDLLVGAIKGARELDWDPSALAGPGAMELLVMARMHGAPMTRKISQMLRSEIDGVTFDLRKLRPLKRGMRSARLDPGPETSPRTP